MDDRNLQKLLEEFSDLFEPGLGTVEGPPIDFTVCSGLAFVLCIVLFVAGLILLFVKIKILHLLYACGGTLLFSFYIVIDTQLIVGGDKRTFALSPEDYIAGALTLYLDVINVFLFILQILSVLREE
ncbi:putative N-methyl-D-aspartate receptor associated protein [Ixodes scapularis]